MQQDVKKKKRRKICHFCADKIDTLDYKNLNRVRRYVSERGKILPRRTTGTCAKHQRVVTRAVMMARSIGLLPYVVD